MKTRQIFTSYRHQGNQGLKDIRYCASCGQQYELKEEGGRIRPVCPACGYVFYKNPSPAVSVLITDGERVLLGKRGPKSYLNGKWCSPCGFIEFDENFLIAACREAKEETGLDIEIQAIINVTFNYLSPQLHSLVIVLLARVSGGEMTAGDDMEVMEWFPLTGPLPEMAFESDIYIIEKYREKSFQEIPVDPDYAILNCNSNEKDDENGGE